MKKSGRYLLIRMLFAYSGMLLAMLISVPLVATVTEGGHEFPIYVVLFGAPTGLIVGLVYCDRRAGLGIRFLVMRGAISVTLTIHFVFGIGLLKFTPFLKNQGYLLIPITVPFLVSILSGLFFNKKSTVSDNSS